MDLKEMADEYDRKAAKLSAEVEVLAQDVVKLTQAENALANAHGICFAAMDSTRCIESGISSLGDNFTDVLAILPYQISTPLIPCTIITLP